MNYDLIVIGAGPAGYVGAIRAAELGKRVVLIERAEVGGTCLNWGCIPTKALLKSAQVYHYCHTAATYGVTIEGDVKPDLATMVKRSRTVAEMMGKGVQMLLKRNNVEVITGTATLRSAHEVEVATAEGTTLLEGENILLATGARPREVAALPIDHQRIITSRDALLLDKLPESMVVVGSGAIGSEFACLYATLGTKVTIVEYMPQLMPLCDAEVAAVAERAFRRQKVTVMTGTAVKGATIEADGVAVEVEGKRGTESLKADIVLSAVGVKSNIENLGLESLGIAIERDKVVVDGEFRTSVANIYAVGDIIATPALAHTASAEAVNCVERICGLNPKRIDYALTPSCIFTTPEVAAVGITEQQAKERGIEYSVGRFQFAASGKAMAAGDRDGFVKLIFDADKHLIGAHIIGGNIVEMLGEPSLAMALGATAKEIAETIHAHPTMYEGIAEAAAQVK